MCAVPHMKVSRVGTMHTETITLIDIGVLCIGLIDKGFLYIGQIDIEKVESLCSDLFVKTEIYHYYFTNAFL